MENKLQWKHQEKLKPKKEILQLDKKLSKLEHGYLSYFITPNKHRC